MNVIRYKGERELGEITKRVFTRLTPRQKERAEAAILKANPQLKDIRKLPRGTVLKVPDLPELEAKRKRNPDNPVVLVREQVADTLEAFGKELGARAKDEKADMKAQQSLLKSRPFKAAIANNELLKGEARNLSRALTRRSREMDERNTAVQAVIKQMLGDL